MPVRDNAATPIANSNVETIRPAPITPPKGADSRATSVAEQQLRPGDRFWRPASAKMCRGPLLSGTSNVLEHLVTLSGFLAKLLANQSASRKHRRHRKRTNQTRMCPEEQSDTPLRPARRHRSDA